MPSTGSRPEWTAPDPASQNWSESSEAERGDAVRPRAGRRGMRRKHGVDQHPDADGIARSSTLNRGECRSHWGDTPSHTPSLASEPG